MKVLVVEDKFKMASLLRRALRGEGVAADLAVRGEDALWMADATRYDAIVTSGSRASRAPTPPAPKTAPASDSPSSALSPRRTAVVRKPRTARAVAPTCPSRYLEHGTTSTSPPAPGLSRAEAKALSAAGGGGSWPWARS